MKEMKLKYLTDGTYREIIDENEEAEAKIFEVSTCDFLLNLKNISIGTSSIAKNPDLNFVEGILMPPWPHEKTNYVTEHRLYAEKFTNIEFSYLVPDETDEKIFTRKTVPHFSVELMSLSEESEFQTSTGVFLGSASYDATSVSFFSYVPEKQMMDIIKSLRADPAATLSLSFHSRGIDRHTLADSEYSSSRAFVSRIEVVPSKSHILDTDTEAGENEPNWFKSSEQITSEKILAQLQSNNRWLSGIAIMMTVALVIVLF